MAQRFIYNTTKSADYSTSRSYYLVQANTSGYVNLNGGTNPANTAGENVSEMYIQEIKWTLNSGAGGTDNWNLRRGANTVLVLRGNSGQMDFQESGFRLEAGGDPQSNLQFVLTGAGDLLIKVRKVAGV